MPSQQYSTIFKVRLYYSIILICCVITKGLVFQDDEVTDVIRDHIDDENEILKYEERNHVKNLSCNESKGDSSFHNDGVELEKGEGTKQTVLPKFLISPLY